MTEDMPSEAFPLKKVVFEGLVTLAVDARDLHRLLGISELFADWILGWVDSGKFLESQDFIRRIHPLHSLSAPSELDIAMSIDMAKEIAFFESSPARNYVRRLLINAQKSTVFGLVAEHRPTFDRPIDQLVEATVTRLFGRMLPPLLTKAISERMIQVRYGKTSGQIWTDQKFPKVGLSAWFGNRLQMAGCKIEGYGELGNTRARLFDPDKANRWLKAGGKAVVNQKILERLGQGHFKFEFSK